jgi:hypothetical protein
MSVAGSLTHIGAMQVLMVKWPFTSRLHLVGRPNHGASRTLMVLECGSIFELLWEGFDVTSVAHAIPVASADFSAVTWFRII